MSAQISAWCFTTYKVGSELTVPDSFKWFRYCVYQKEKCPTTQRVHFQGYIEFTRSVRMNKVKTLFNDKTMHLEPKQGSREDARSYCMSKTWKGKDKGWLEGPWEFGVFQLEPGKRLDLKVARETILKKRKLDDCYKDPELDQITSKYPRWVEKIHSTKDVDHEINIDLYDWQSEIYELLQGPPEHRRIFWIWSDESGTGKTTFRDWVSLKMDVLPASGKLTDILYAYDNNDVIWFDFTRAQNGYESYASLEELSNIGFKLSTKYTPLRKFVKAHIVVTSNHEPNEERLPQRFKVYHVPRHSNQPATLTTTSQPLVLAKPANGGRSDDLITNLDDYFNE